MRLDDALISLIAATAEATTCPPFSADSRDPAASWLACRAFSAFCFTVDVISSRLAAVSSRLEACSCAPLATSSDAVANSWAAEETLPDASLTSNSASRIPCTAWFNALTAHLRGKPLECSRAPARDERPQ
jgi:hypothetical protein